MTGGTKTGDTMTGGTMTLIYIIFDSTLFVVSKDELT